ncbi:hypothetical protein Tco_1122074 [Tanacetum coccineum]|uniref:Uncharacterized protein n=1 Tax=Tanacetum coccineum TaxID=301880 RepID=A0ABQ5IZP6_9ASTR
MKKQAYNIIKTKDSRTQQQSNLNKYKEARFKISPQEFEDHIIGEIVSLKYVSEHGSSESAGYLLRESSLRGRLRSNLVYIMQQHSKGSSEGSSIIPEVLDKLKDNSGSSSNSLSGSDDEVQDVSSDEENKADENKANAEVIQSMMDVPIYQEDPAVQRTPLFDIAISMVTEKTTSKPTPLTTQAEVTNVSESVSSLKFEQRPTELEKKVEAIPKRAWTEKDQKTD